MTVKATLAPGTGGSAVKSLLLHGISRLPVESTTVAISSSFTSPLNRPVGRLAETLTGIPIPVGSPSMISIMLPLLFATRPAAAVNILVKICGTVDIDINITAAPATTGPAGDANSYPNSETKP